MNEMYQFLHTVLHLECESARRVRKMLYIFNGHNIILAMYNTQVFFDKVGVAIRETMGMGHLVVSLTRLLPYMLSLSLSYPRRKKNAQLVQIP